MPGPGGVSAPRGVPGPGVVTGPGDGIPACTEADPPVNRMTDRCKNITFTTSLRTVIIIHGEVSRANLSNHRPQKKSAAR